MNVSLCISFKDLVITFKAFLQCQFACLCQRYSLTSDHTYLLSWFYAFSSGNKAVRHIHATVWYSNVLNAIMVYTYIASCTASA